MHDEIKILDIEEKQNSFNVVFEVPGHHYNQEYPKRISHSFPLEPKLLEKNDDGVYKFEKSLRSNYLKDETKENKKQQCCNKIKEVKQNVKGKKHQQK